MPSERDDAHPAPARQLADASGGLPAVHPRQAEVHEDQVWRICLHGRHGLDRKVAMAISGHRSESAFERYNIDTDEDLREAVEKVASYVGQLSSPPTVVPMAVRREG